MYNVRCSNSGKMSAKQKIMMRDRNCIKKPYIIFFYRKVKGLQRGTGNRNRMYMKDVATLEKICTKQKIMMRD